MQMAHYGNYQIAESCSGEVLEPLYSTMASHDDFGTSGREVKSSFSSEENTTGGPDFKTTPMHC